MTIFGTRPEAIKMAPLIKELKSRKEIKCIVCVTAQHRQMLDQVLNIFNIIPDYDLNIMTEGQTLTQITCCALNGLEKIIKKEKPNITLIHGDTTTTFAGALASYYCKVDVGHVEAGLRTWNKYSPYPEEINRQLVGKIADLHFAPTNQNKQNLLKEGKSPNSIFITGNTVIDALLYIAGQDYTFEDEKLNDFVKNKKIILLTFQENTTLTMFKAIQAKKESEKNCYS